jgi:NADH:ubiquinone oxidoreductase subunit 2 (subunit N)
MAGVVLAYVRVVGALFVGSRRPVAANVRGEPAGVLILALALIVLALGIYPNPLLETVQSITQRLAFFSG